MTIVSFRADIEHAFDCRNEAALAAYGMDAAALSDISWRDQMRSNGEARTQAFAPQRVENSYHALLVKSCAHGSFASDLNLVLWHWDDAAPSRLIVIDDENRLA